MIVCRRSVRVYASNEQPLLAYPLSSSHPRYYHGHIIQTILFVIMPERRLCGCRWVCIAERGCKICLEAEYSAYLEHTCLPWLDDSTWRMPCIRGAWCCWPLDAINIGSTMHLITSEYDVVGEVDRPRNRVIPLFEGSYPYPTNQEAKVQELGVFVPSS